MAAKNESSQYSEGTVHHKEMTSVKLANKKSETFVSAIENRYTRTLPAGFGTNILSYGESRYSDGEG